MKKVLGVLILVCISIVAQAQQLDAYIPSDAKAVGTLKGKNFIDLLSISEFNQSATGKRFLEKISEKVGKEYQDASDFGIRLDANAYYFYQSNDSVGFHSLLIPLASVSKFESFVASKDSSIQRKNNYNILSDSSIILLWDNQKALVTLGQPRISFFQNDTVAERYNLANEYGYGNYLDNYLYEDTTVIIDTAYDEVIIEEAPIEEETEVYIEEAPEEETYDDESYQPSYSDTTVIVDNYEDYAAEDTYYDSYLNKIEVQKQKRDSIGRVWAVQNAEILFSPLTKKSILSDVAYVKSVDAKAEASIWIKNPFFVYENDYSLGNAFFDNSFFNNLGNINGHVYFEDDHFKVSTSMRVEGEAAQSFKRIYSRKINRKFLKYIDSKKALGYLGYAINSQSYLEELPKMIAAAYSPLALGLGTDEDAINLGADLFSLFLDEKAIGKMIKGDALFVLNGVTEKEVTYKDYEYDEEYNATEVEKTKKEPVPDYLLMVSSDDMDLIKKMLDYGVKKKLLTKNEGIYKIQTPEEAFNSYLLLKGGIVFLSPSYQDLNKIKKGSFKGHISSNHRKMIRKNKFLAYVSPEKIFSAVPQKESELLFNKAPFLYQMKDMGGVYMRSAGIKGNNVSGEFVIETSKDHKNAFKYLFSLIDVMSR